jgi:hypothetical protein
MSTKEPLTVKPQSLYPVRDSLSEVVDEAVSQLPIINRNHLTTLLMTYHNTLLHVQREEIKANSVLKSGTF